MIHVFRAVSDVLNVFPGAWHPNNRQTNKNKQQTVNNSPDTNTCILSEGSLWIFPVSSRKQSVKMFLFFLTVAKCVTREEKDNEPNTNNKQWTLHWLQCTRFKHAHHFHMNKILPGWSKCRASYFIYTEVNQAIWAQFFSSGQDRRVEVQDSGRSGHLNSAVWVSTSVSTGTAGLDTEM